MPSAQIVLSAITLVVGVLTAVLVWRSNTSATGQREQQARREEWFRRYAWSVDQADSDSQFRREIGLESIDQLAKSPLAGADEFAMVEGALRFARQRGRAERAILEEQQAEDQKEQR